MTSGTDIWKGIVDMYAKRSDPEGARVLAVVYWRTLLAIAFLIVVLSITYGEWTLYGILHDSGGTSSTRVPPPALDQASINAALTTFRQRASTYNALRAHSSGTFSDPSR